MTDPNRVLAALRRTGSETQVTDVIAAVCRDENVAAEFARLVLAASPHSPIPPDAIPARLRCAREVPVDDGRVDLSFEDAEGAFHLLVELKLHSGFGPSQLRRYLATLSPDADHAALVAITRTVPRHGERHAKTDPRFAGSVRWSRLLGGMRELNVLPPPACAQWRAFLDILDLEGAMGFTTPDLQLLDAWAVAKRAGEHIDLLLGSLHDEVRAIAEGLGSCPGDDDGPPPGELFLQRKGGEAIHRAGGDAMFRLRIRPGGGERLRLGLRGSRGPLRVMVAVLPPSGDTPAAHEARHALRQLGSERRTGSRAFYWYRELSETEKADSALPEIILEWMRDRVDAIAGTGVAAVWAAEDSTTMQAL